MHLVRSAAIAVTTIATIGLAGAVHADTVYNDLDGTIDPVLETMNLGWDSVNLVGTTGSTMLQMRVDGPAEGDRGGCNVQGAPQWVDVTASSTDTSVVVLTNGPTYRFDLCTDTPTVAVQATGLGGADILFEVTDFASSPGATVVFPTEAADFHVNVTENGSSTGCDADPAAPAWAAAILQKSGYKPGAKQTTNLISKIAGEMTQGADFAGIQKPVHPEYEDAVQARLEVLTGNANLASAQAAARPGWVCAPTS